MSQFEDDVEKMSNMLGQAGKQEEEWTRAVAMGLAAITMALIDKGIVTTEEFNKYAEVAEKEIDEENKRKREAAIKAFNEQFPGVYDIFGKMFFGEDKK